METTTPDHEHVRLLKTEHPVGIVGYGAYVPRYRLPAREVARIWTAGTGGLPIEEKSVPGLDEDVATMSIEAARNALARAQIDPRDLRAVWVGSESHPYAVKPTSTIVAEAIGAGAQHPGRRLGICLQSRHRSHGRRHGLRWLPNCALRPGHRHGYRPGPPG